MNYHECDDNGPTILTVYRHDYIYVESLPGSNLYYRMFPNRKYKMFGNEREVFTQRDIDNLDDISGGSCTCLVCWTLKNRKR